jgi:DNA polymerase-2
MQILTALRTGVLVPWHKQQAERPKDVLDLLRADQGGLVYQPIPGLHANVAEVDFISMYPSIMERFNISPETVGAPASADGPKPEEDGFPVVPQLGIRIDPNRRGIVPETLKPLLEKRIALKNRLALLPRWDPRTLAYKARASAHKWLLVTCFGYLGYKNARFGRIESHEAVTAYGRECLLRAKEAAEDMGCTVIHLYVDGMWAKRDGLSKPADFQPLLEQITESTGLPIALDGVYKWVAFLPSRVDARVPVANRYFGAFQDGSIKMRGIEARRGDTCPFIARAQVEMLERMAKEEASGLTAILPELYDLLRRKVWDVRHGRVKPVDLLMSLKLSRTLEEYKTPSPAARAAAQLAAAGKILRPGDKVRFLCMLGEPGVHAWDLPEPPDLRSLNAARYVELLLRAGAAVVQPLGVSEEALKARVLHNVSQPRENRLLRLRLSDKPPVGRLSIAGHRVLPAPHISSE